MSGRTKQATGWVFGAVVAVALGFGLTVATAKPAEAMTCPNDGWNFLGFKATKPLCQSACATLHPDLDHIVYGVNQCCNCIF